MRAPGFRKDRAEALDEAAMECLFCPVCGDSVTVDERSNWNLQLVRALECKKHGFFLIKWSPARKKISVRWIPDRYLPDLS
jgi:hypothetical protein